MRLRRFLTRAIGLADAPGDDEDQLLRKRIGILAGFLTVVAPLGAPFLAPGNPFAGALAIGLSLVSIANLVVVARTRAFERYVIVLLLAGAAFTFAMDILTGGLSAGAGIIWAFLGPVYAVLALGPRKAVPWMALFVAMVVVAVAIDPVVARATTPASEAVRLISFGQNIVVPLAITFLLFRYIDMRRREAQATSDDLLMNAIPKSIAVRLKRGEHRIAEKYPDITVLFADIAGFTQWSNQAGPDRVVGLLDGLFSRFDELAAASGVEKIKTIGDSYMAVAGAPQPRADHAEASLSFARALLEAVAEWRTTNRLDLDLRIGVASGPAVGGVIGQKRIVFDLWGDTVNLASRLESSGVPGRIQVSASTRRLLDGSNRFEPRELEAKGLGRVTAYLVD